MSGSLTTVIRRKAVFMNAGSYFFGGVAVAGFAGAGLGWGGGVILMGSAVGVRFILMFSSSIGMMIIRPIGCLPR
jgi:hypothetical protein